MACLLSHSLGENLKVETETAKVHVCEQEHMAESIIQIESAKEQRNQIQEEYKKRSHEKQSIEKNKQELEHDCKQR